MQGRFGAGNRSSVGIDDFPADFDVRRRLIVVLNDRSEIERGEIAAQGRPDRALPPAQMDGVRLDQPNVAIDTRPFIKPAVAETGIDAQHDIIPLAVRQEFGEIEAERRVAVVVAADKAAVDEHHDIAKCAVELNPNASAAIARWNIEGSAIPADAGFGIMAAKRLVTMRSQHAVAQTGIVIDEGQFDSPVMR